MGNVAPVSNDDLIFPAGIGVLDRGTNNDIFNATFRSMRFESGDYKLTGDAVKLSGDLTVLSSLQPITVTFDITFTAANHVINVGAASTLNLNGRLKNFVGDGLITKIGPGDLGFGGDFTNSLSQPLHVDQGQLRVRKASPGVVAYAGPLTIGGGVSGPAGVAAVLVEQSGSLPNLPSLTINETANSVGVLNLGANTVRVGTLKLKGGRVQGGRLQLNGDVIIESSSTSASIVNGTLELGAAERRFKVASGGILEITSAIPQSTTFGPAGQGLRQEDLNNDGGGTIRFFPVAANTYNGRTVISAGRMEINAAVAGRTVIPGDILVGSATGKQATLDSSGENVIADTSNLRLIGSGVFQQFGGSETIASLFMIEQSGFLSFAPGPKVFRILGTANVDEQAVFSAENTSEVIFEGDVRILGGTVVSDRSQIIFRRDLTLVAGRAESRNFSGVDLGRLFFQRSIVTQASANPSVVTGMIQFQAGGFSSVLAHRIDVPDGAANNDLVINATIEQGSSSKKLFKAGLGRMVINGDNTAANEIELAAGTLFVNGAQSNNASKVTVTQGRFGGTGSLRNVILNGGTLAPGAAVGLLTSSDITLVGPAKLEIQLNGLTPITQHDQLLVGDFVLGNFTPNLPVLQLLVNFDALLGQTFEIADVTTDTGTFGQFIDPAGNVLTEGSTFIAGGKAFQISYVGGDGNDVTVTRVSTPPAFADRMLTSVVREGDFATLSGVITEPDSEDTFFLDVNWGDGTTETFTFAPGTPRQVAVAHRYLDDGIAGTRRDIYQVHLAWRDEHGGSNSADLQTIVRNVRPTLASVAFDSPPLLGQVAVLRGQILDPSPRDAFRLKINWGDGSAIETVLLPAGTTEFRLTHKFKSVGYHRVRIRAVDDDGGRGSLGLTIFVRRS